MSQEVIDKLDCQSTKTLTLTMGDRVCNNTVEWNDVSFGSTSRGGRCPECERLRLYDDSAQHQNAFFMEYDT
ncbi:hypothetical protein ONS96_001646 [Cadophora gregata f. sp. sojae]|nr:hypothetical protein ONS96_001646 [Cadophora gregata f. sp. sojae]